MVAKVLIINESKIDLSRISFELKDSYFALQFSKSIEDSLRIIGTQSIDLVLISIPQKISNLFFDFLSLLKQLCGVIPIVGLLESKKDVNISQFFISTIDDFVYSDINGATLIRRINSLVKMKNMFDENLLSHMHISEANQRKIVVIFHDNVDFLHESILKNTEVIMLETWPVVDNLNYSDLFLINTNNARANECCANIHLKQSNKYKPIVLTFSPKTKEKAKQAMKLDIGCTDIIDITFNRIIIASRLNSLIKYKKLYENFSMKIKRSLYLSAIDSTTEVYNRSFFEDFLARNDHNFVGSAVLMIDIDKFKFINDKFGHSFADSTLKHISLNIKKYVRSSDIIARYGGDEFIIVMNAISKQIVLEVANRIQKKIESSPFNGVQCTVSIGVCCVASGEKIQIRDAISVADKFMYIAKQSGGNSVKICA